MNKPYEFIEHVMDETGTFITDIWQSGNTGRFSSVLTDLAGTDNDFETVEDIRAAIHKFYRGEI